jgi:Grx4 family monothiol glutaredoxin
MSLSEITSLAALEGKTKAVLLFGASWHESCPPLEAVLSALATTAPAIFFAKVDAEDCDALTESLNVTVVPTLIFLNGSNNNVTERLEGVVDPSQVTVAVQRLVAASSSSSASLTTTAAATTSTTTTTETTTTTSTTPSSSLTERLDRLIRSDAVMLFMKGLPTAPKCGFSRQVVELLQAHEVPFGSFDILSDDEVRQGLKQHSDWPTYPQLYVHGELIGGLDILKELAEEGPLKVEWNISEDDYSSTTTTLNDRLSQLVHRHHVMVFMKGLPSAPQCGFSRQLIAMLDESGVSYDAFNILEDDEVRQGLKAYSQWPTYPQLYVKGELVGGLDICKELQESEDEWKEMLLQQP